MPIWEPWRGCHRYSEGCKYCYIHKGDARRGDDTDNIILTGKMNAPLARDKKGEYKLQPGKTVYLCFSSDFLLEEADEWRAECWRIMRERSDLDFLFLTKRITRFSDCLPCDWGDGYENVTVGCTVENQERADERLSVFSGLPIKHKNIIIQPMISEVNVEKYLDGTELVVVGGESDREARPLDYNWVLSVREQCVRRGVKFEFRQCGSHFIKDGQMINLNPFKLMSEARALNIDYYGKADKK